MPALRNVGKRRSATSRRIANARAGLPQETRAVLIAEDRPAARTRRRRTRRTSNPKVVVRYRSKRRNSRKGVRVRRNPGSLRRRVWGRRTA